MANFILDYIRGVESFISANHFSIHGHGQSFLKNCISFLWYEEIIVIGYNLVSFLNNFRENISDLTECNVLYNNEHSIWIWFFLLIDNGFHLKITLRILNPENNQVYSCKSEKCCYFHNRFQYQYRFQYQSKIIRVIQIKKKRINFLFSAVIYFPLSIQMNILTLCI